MSTVLNAVFNTIVSLIAGLAGPGAPAPEAPAVGAEAVITVVNADADQLLSVDDALNRFEEAGLDLPTLVIEFAPDGDTTLCKGNGALFRHGSGDVAHRILICRRSALFLSHELAHAYVDANLDAAARQPFLDRWGLDEWSDESAAWSARGNERAANTIAMTLGLEAPTTDANVTALVCGYETLTGSSHPNLANADCEGVVAV